VVDEVLDGAQSVVLEQAENRLHLQKALMVALVDARRAAMNGKATTVEVEAASAVPASP